MGIEIERKFLLSSELWRQGASGERFCQGYVYAPEGIVRVRIAGNEAFLTVKGRNSGMTRKEFEYPIPVADAKEMLDIICAKPFIEKIRYKVEHQGKTWEIDEFEGDNAGLILAELELSREDEDFEPPEWLGREVTGDPRYHNSALVRNPYKNWKTR